MLVVPQLSQVLVGSAASVYQLTVVQLPSDQLEFVKVPPLPWSSVLNCLRLVPLTLSLTGASGGSLLLEWAPVEVVTSVAALFETASAFGPSDRS